MEFFHISRRERWYIAFFLNAAIVCQLVHQVLHFVWDDVIVYFSSPEGQISLATGPIAGLVTGVGAGIIQFRAEDRLHLRAPDRFPPGLLATAREAVRRVRSGEGLASLLADIKAENKANRSSAAAKQKRPPVTGHVVV